MCFKASSIFSVTWSNLGDIISEFFLNSFIRLCPSFRLPPRIRTAWHWLWFSCQLALGSSCRVSSGGAVYSVVMFQWAPLSQGQNHCMHIREADCYKADITQQSMLITYPYSPDDHICLCLDLTATHADEVESDVISRSTCVFALGTQPHWWPFIHPCSKVIGIFFCNVERWYLNLKYRLAILWVVLWGVLV